MLGHYPLSFTPAPQSIEIVNMMNVTESAQLKALTLSLVEYREGKYCVNAVGERVSYNDGTSRFVSPIHLPANIRILRLIFTLNPLIYVIDLTGTGYGDTIIIIMRQAILLVNSWL